MVRHIQVINCKEIKSTAFAQLFIVIHAKLITNKFRWLHAKTDTLGGFSQ